MKYLKAFYNVSFNLPVYIAGPDSIVDAEDFCILIEDADDGPRSWDFALDDIESSVRTAVPLAEDIEIDVRDVDSIVKSATDGAIAYDLTDLVPVKSIRRHVAERTMEDLMERASSAAYAGDVRSFLSLADEIRELSESLLNE